MIRTAALLIGVLALTSCDPAQGPADETPCAADSLIAQCPAGTNPIVGITADQACDTQIGGIVSEVEGAAAGACFGVVGCQVYCQFAVPCACGVAQITADGVLCASCDGAASCGNGLCEGGETPVSCPVDCGADCVADEQRCVDEDLEICNLQGRWERLPCPSGEVCRVEGAVSACRPDDRIIDADGGVDGGAGGGGGELIEGRVYPGPAEWPAAAPDLSGAGLPAELTPRRIALRRVDGRGRATPLGEAFQAVRPTVWIAEVDPQSDATRIAGWGAGSLRLDDRGALQGTTPNPFEVDVRAMHARGDRVVFAGFGTSQLFVLDRRTGERFTSRAYDQYRVNREWSVRLSADGQSVVAWLISTPPAEDAVALLWHLPTGEQTLIAPQNEATSGHVAINGDGSVIAISTAEDALERLDGQPGLPVVALWDTATQTRIASITTLRSFARIMGFTADGQRLVLITNDENRDMLAEVWSAETVPRKLHTLDAEAVTYVGFAPDGRTVITTGIESTPQSGPTPTHLIWDTVDGRRIGALPNPEPRPADGWVGLFVGPGGVVADYWGDNSDAVLQLFE